MSGAPEVSFVVPSYNYGRYLRACIDSILSQDRERDFEVVVVDDASTDDSADILRSYADPRVRAFFHAANKGHVDTINEGFALARGRFIARIDSDDRYRPHFLRKAMEVFDANDSVGVVHANAAWIDPEGRVLSEFPEHPHGRREFEGSEFAALLLRNFLPAPTIIARRGAWDDALPIPAGLGFSDWYLSLRMARKHTFHYIPEALAEYRMHPKGLHITMIRAKTEEPTVLRVLDEIFKEGAEDKAFRDRVYSQQYRMLADKYFGEGMNEDARRCYGAAIRRSPALALDAGVARRFMAAVVGREYYEYVKRTLARRRAARSGSSG